MNSPPTITTQPASQTVVAGNDPTFTVAAAGSPTPTFQWTLNGAPIAGATNASLTLVNVTAANAGTYRATATNSKGSVTSSPATLAVVIPPVVTTQPVSRTVLTGSSVSLGVVATGTPTLAYQWALNGVAIPGATSSSLLLTNVHLGAAGTYTVTVTNAAGRATSRGAVLKVY